MYVCSYVRTYVCMYACIYVCISCKRVYVERNNKICQIMFKKKKKRKSSLLNGCTKFVYHCSGLRAILLKHF